MPAFGQKDFKIAMKFVKQLRFNFGRIQKVIVLRKIAHHGIEQNTGMITEAGKIVQSPFCIKS